MKNDNELVKVEKQPIRNLNYQETRKEAESNVYNLLAMGYSNRDIIDKLVKDEFNIGKCYTYESARNLLYDCKHQIKEQFGEVQNEVREDIYMKLTDLYKKNYKRKDYKECREILKDVAKLTGISQNNSVLVNKETGDIVISFGFDN